MVISAVVAIDNNGVIGRGGRLPWNLPADLARFKSLTTGHPIIMGRKTYESIGRALPGRQNIIITRDNSYKAEGCEVVGSLDEALAAANDKQEVCIIGGQDIFELAMPKINLIHLTRIDAEIPGDRFFKYNPGDWLETWSEKHPN